MYFEYFSFFLSPQELDWIWKLIESFIPRDYVFFGCHAGALRGLRSSSFHKIKPLQLQGVLTGWASACLTILG